MEILQFSIYKFQYKRFNSIVLNGYEEHMLKKLKLSNFRLFDNPVTVHFRPITILIGRNNSGKSSIIKFLLMLRQSLNKDSSLFLNPEGTEVNLGNFDGLENSVMKQNSLTGKHSLHFELTVKEKKTPGDTVVSYIQRKEPNNNMNIELSYTTSAEISYQKKEKNVKRHEVSVFYNGREQLFRNKDNPEENNINLLDFSKELETEEESTEKEATKDIIKTLRDNINNLRHLLPVRGDEKSIIIVRDPPLIHVGQNGKYTLAHLQKIKSSDKDKYDFIRRYMKEVAGINEIDFKKSESSDTSECFATNRLTKAKTLIGNFGFGVSQCLPIFVQGALMPAHSSLMIEQPEVQLHPTAQLELGSFFKDLWNKYKVGSIIETHSENILLRLRRLIAREELQPEDVSIAFFDFDDKNKQPIIKELNINKDGSMEEGLPIEFFGKNLEEVLGIGAGE